MVVDDLLLVLLMFFCLIDAAVNCGVDIVVGFVVQTFLVFYVLGVHDVLSAWWLWVSQCRLS